MNPHFELLKQAHEELSQLNHRFVFIGGATVSLHIDDPASSPVRVTRDVDFVVEVASYSEFTTIESQLREVGFKQNLLVDQEPICRWHKGELCVDILPTSPEIIGFAPARWFQEGFENAKLFELPDGKQIEAFSTLYLIATKIDAFVGRGNDDWLASQDIEDIATILDGRLSIRDELHEDNEVAEFIRCWLKKHSASMLDVLAGHAGYQRADYLLAQFK